MRAEPLNLTERDFDAYSVDKASSNAFSRPRLELKRRALAWARPVVARLTELGIAVEAQGSDEFPTLRNKKRVDSQWIWLARDVAAREELERLLDASQRLAEAIDAQPFTRHALLALRIDAAVVEVCFALHAEARVDVENLRAQLDRTRPGVEALVAALEALPEEFAFGTGADLAPCGAATPDAVRAALDRAVAEGSALWVGWRLPRATALEHAEILDEQLEDALVALAPLYKLVAWSRDNDHVELERRMQGAERERARAHADAQEKNEQWLAARARERERSREEARVRHEDKPTLATLFGPPRGATTSARAPHRPEGGEAPAAGGRSAATPDGRLVANSRASLRSDAPVTNSRASLRSDAPVTNSRGAPAPVAERAPASPRPPDKLEKGARVRVRSGPFADKLGVVGELDGRGGARVLLGLLSSRIALEELEPIVEGRERPALQSSHRRPLAPAPRKAR